MPAAMNRRVTVLATVIVASAVTASAAAASTGTTGAASHPATAHVAPVRPATVPNGAASLAVRATLSSSFAKAFNKVPGSISGYVVIDGLGTALDHRGTASQAPASTTKLITSGAALLTMGANYRFATTVSRTGSDGVVPGTAATTAPTTSPTPADTGSPAPDPAAPVGGASPSPGTAAPTDPATPAPTATTAPTAAPAPVYLATDSSGTLHGDLVLTGAGDPSFSSGDLNGLARSLRAAGVKKVTGGLYLDVSHLDTQRGAPGWKAGYIGGEAGPLSALMVDGNHRTRAASYLRDPSQTNLALFVADLKKAGVAVAGRSQVGRSPHATTAVVASHQSAPLSTLLRHMDKDSDNTYAEEILKDIGATTGTGSSAAGIAVERRLAGSFGLTLGRLVDGSGLSTYDRLTAAQEAGWLQALDTTAAGPALRAALPISCKDGTLSGRLCGSGLTGHVQAKTGTLDHTADLAGYTTTRSGRRIWFAFMADRSNDAAARRAIDSEVAALARSNF